MFHCYCDLHCTIAHQQCISVDFAFIKKFDIGCDFVVDLVVHYYFQELTNLDALTFSSCAKNSFQ